jgi:hypothetical protein
LSRLAIFGATFSTSNEEEEEEEKRFQVIV